MQKVTALIVLFYMFSSAASEWKEYGDVGGFKVHTRAEPNSNIRGVKAVGTIDADMLTVMAHLRDVAGSVKWIPDLKEKYTTKDLGDTAATTYSVTGMPWPLSDRDMLVHNSLELDRENKLLYVLGKSIKDASHPPVAKYERAQITYANMGFRPITKSKTYVELTIFADPGGMIPSFAVNYYQRKWPTKFLRALEKRCHNTPMVARPGLKTMAAELLKEMGLPTNYFPQLQSIVQSSPPKADSL